MNLHYIIRFHWNEAPPGAHLHQKGVPVPTKTVPKTVTISFCVKPGHCAATIKGVLAEMEPEQIRQLCADFAESWLKFHATQKDESLELDFACNFHKDTVKAKVREILQKYGIRLKG
jgi:hypothetical protein